MSEQTDFTVDLPRFKCHKIVSAAKIVAIDHGCRLDLMPHGVVEVTVKWAEEKGVEVGGYYVVYDDDYTSYSPAKAFEEGYAPLAPAVPPAEDDLTIAAAITRAQDILAVPEMLLDHRGARKIIIGLLAGLQSSPCYFKAMQKGEEVFVLMQHDRAAPDTIDIWAGLSEAHGCGLDKLLDARGIAERWRAQPLDNTKWST